MPNPTLPATELNRVKAPAGQALIRFDSPVDVAAITVNGSPLAGESSGPVVLTDTSDGYTYQLGSTDGILFLSLPLTGATTEALTINTSSGNVLNTPVANFATGKLKINGVTFETALGAKLANDGGLITTDGFGGIIAGGFNACGLNGGDTVQLSGAAGTLDVTGTNVLTGFTGSGTSSGTNTGDNSANSTYASDYRAANFVAGTNYLAPNGSAAALTSFPTLNQSTTGSAASLTTPRTINGVSFDGTANVTVTAAAGTLTGTTLASNVTASSLTSVGTLGSLTVTAPIAGSVTGNAATVTTNANLTGPVTSTGNATAIANGAISNAMLANAAVASLSGTNTGDQDLSGYQTKAGVLALTGFSSITGTVADANIASAATWNAKQSALTFGTGVQAALGVNVGSAGAPVLFGDALGTPTSGNLGSCTVVKTGTLLSGFTTGAVLRAGGNGKFEEYALGFGVSTALGLAMGASGGFAQINGPVSFTTMAASGIATFTSGVTTGTGASSGVVLAADSLTTGTAMNLSGSVRTTGTLLNIAGTSTALAAGNNLAKITSSGANASSGITATGLTISVTNTGTTSTNIPLTLTASGGTNNVALNITAGGIRASDGSSTAPSYGYASATDMGWSYASTGQIAYHAGTLAYRLDYNKLQLCSSLPIAFSSTTGFGTDDARISRSAAGVLQIGTTSSNALGSLLLTDLTMSGNLSMGKTVTATGTTGAQTINKSSGAVNFAAAATSLVVTNSLVTTSSVILCTVGTNDTTMKTVAVVAASGSFTIYANAAATAETRVFFHVTN